MEFNPTFAIVNNEECDLHYWYQGSGPLFVFVPGGNGHGRQYNAIMAKLSDRYTCVTFDRRQMSASQVKVNKLLNPPQQGRDILAVIKAMGFSKATIFASSGGGIIAFQFAIDYPEVIEHLISHEAPSIMLLPEAGAMFERCLYILELRKSQGIDVAHAEFMKFFKGLELEGVPRTVPPEPENNINFWDYEFWILTTFLPDLRRLVEKKVSVGLMTGIESKDAFYALTTYEQEKILGCPRFDVPGHHQAFEVEVEKFLPHLLKMIETLQARKAAQA